MARVRNDGVSSVYKMSLGGRAASKFALPGLIAAAVVTAIVLVARPRRPPPPEPVITALAAPQAAAMAMESEPEVIRFASPSAEVLEVHGFERSRSDPAAEASVAIRRRAEMRVRWPSPAPRRAVLDLYVPPRSPFRALRVLLNGHKVGRLELGPDRRRYAFDLPAARQHEGGNVLTFIFGAEADAARDEDRAPDGAAGRVFGLAIGAPSRAMDEIAAAISEAELFVSIGTSGNVYPAAGLVGEARAVGIPCIELNLDPSENAGAFTDARYGKASEIVPEWVAEVLAAGA